uniref:Uncharacterized protein n=1 Tax=Rhizophora mucronata TaxID=61149 RepID=A0A2P2JMS9_RHIMU
MHTFIYKLAFVFPYSYPKAQSETIDALVCFQPSKWKLVLLKFTHWCLAWPLFSVCVIAIFLPLSFSTL